MRHPAPASRSFVLASGCGRSTWTPPPWLTRARTHDDNTSIVNHYSINATTRLLTRPRSFTDADR